MISCYNMEGATTPTHPRRQQPTPLCLKPGVYLVPCGTPCNLLAVHSLASSDPHLHKAFMTYVWFHKAFTTYAWLEKAFMTYIWQHEA